jgi:RNA polymerase sigma-70 factor (ECF subfamily)
VTAGPPVSRWDQLTDEELVDRAQGGSSRAFEVLLRRHQRSMYGASRRLLGDSDEAQDALQEAFITSWRTLPEFRSEAKFSTWMYRIVTTRSLNELRRRKPAEPLPEDDGPAAAQFVATTGSPAAHAEGSAMMQALQQALAALPEDLRVCWLAREIDNLSYEEIYEIVRAPVSTVRGRIARARSTLAEAMSAWR